MRKLVHSFFYGSTTLLLLTGGFDPQIARQLPRHYRIRMAGMGFSIIVSAILAFFSGLHTALAMSGSMAVGIAFASLWALLIGFLEFQIIVYMGKQNSRWVAIMRILASFVFAALISTPLILEACRGPIAQWLNDQKNSKLKEIEARYESKIDQEVRKPLLASQEELNEKQKSYLEEVDGTGGSGFRGIGPWTIMKKAAYDSARSRADRLELTLAVHKEKLDSAYRAERAEAEENFATDELAQIRALYELMDDPAVFVRWVLLFLGIVLLETMPLVLKLSNRSLFDDYEKLVKLAAAAVVITYNHEIGVATQQTNLENDVHTINNLTSTADGALTASSGIVDEELRKLRNDAVRGTVKKAVNKVVEGPEVTTVEGQPILDPEKVTETTDPKGSILSTYKMVIGENIAEHPFRIDAGMAAKAARICAGAKTEREIVHCLYTYLQANYPYDKDHDKVKKYRIAEEVERDKTGVCGEISALFIALSRYLGLRASYVYVQTDNTGQHVNHACVQVQYADGSTQLVDISYNTENIHHIHFEVLADEEVSRRFSAWRRAS
ncbi:DUF4407 domain-containing protein [Terrimonas sp. NA20]|uniref:DUF4407 domain-containing protein n=1 Tax=Terrimonas ginsenosidimutans TaxID=2908004 RepID=A0ABS9KK44_9BACT|nr:DUF4407 domain-containing protein [Terrimonas ginsenosidimutans]MCG2612695.1 DUF4407 domain-containing protein [Terrimonas ginsenosidimutans]